MNRTKNKSLFTNIQKQRKIRALIRITSRSRSKWTPRNSFFPFCLSVSLLLLLWLALYVCYLSFSHSPSSTFSSSNTISHIKTISKIKLYNPNRTQIFIFFNDHLKNSSSYLLLFSFFFLLLSLSLFFFLWFFVNFLRNPNLI